MPDFTPDELEAERKELIAHLEEIGALVPDCPGCKVFYDHPSVSPLAPRHKPSKNCESGKRPHCTCDVCF